MGLLLLKQKGLAALTSSLIELQLLANLPQDFGKSL